jgi:hypothetical protein
MPLLRTLERRTLGTRLLLGFGGVMLVALALGVQSLQNLRVMRDKTRQLYEKELLGVAHIKEAERPIDPHRPLAAADDARPGCRAARPRPPGGRRRRRHPATGDPGSAGRDLPPENQKKLAQFESEFARYWQNVGAPSP